MPAIPSWLLEPLWHQFASPLPDHPVYDSVDPLGSHRSRTPDRRLRGKGPRPRGHGTSPRSPPLSLLIRLRRPQRPHVPERGRCMVVTIGELSHVSGPVVVGPMGSDGRFGG